MIGSFTYQGFAQSTYYVSTTGSDSLGGLEEEEAFATISYAVTVAQHGDTILVLPGTYTNASYGTIDVWKEERTVEIVNKTSSTGDYLVIKTKEDTVTLLGDGNFVFQIRNSSYIRVEGFYIEGESENIPLPFAKQYQFTYRDSLKEERERISPEMADSISTIEDLTLDTLTNITRPTYFNTSGISVNASHHIDILNNTVSDMPGEGIRSFDSDFLTIVGNTVFNCSGRSSTGVHGLSIYTLNSSLDTANIDFEGQRVLIARNRVYGNVNELISWSALKNKITPHIDEGKGITIQRCIPRDTNGWNKGIIRIENNLSYRNGFSGIQVNSGSRIEIVNNTCYENNVSSIDSEEGDQHGISVQNGNDIVIANNIIQANPAISQGKGKALKVSNDSGESGFLTVTDNLILGNLNRRAESVSVNALDTIPLFVDEDGDDFSLQVNSPAIDAANVQYAPVGDFYSKDRGTSPDIGAIELVSIPLNREKNLLGKVRVFPNPTDNKLRIQGMNFNKNEVKIYNILGQDFTQTIEVEKNQLSLNKLPTGIYLLRVKSYVSKFYKN